MTEIYVIRHVQAEGNLFRMMQGHWDGNVTELGCRQRDALALRFRDINIDALYSSDLSRAVFTASAITQYHDIEMQIDRRLREINTGSWEGVPFSNLEWNYPKQYYNFMNRAEDFSFEGAETFRQVQDRMMEALRDIAEANDGKTVAVTSHGVSIRCLVCALLGISLNDTKNAPVFVNTGVARILYDKGKFTVDYINDSSHLGDLPRTHATISVMFRDEAIDPREHRDFYCSCYADAWKSAHGSLKGFNPEPYYLSAVEHYLYDPKSVFMIYHGDKPVGLLDLDSAKGAHAKYGWVSLLYLSEEYRHQNYGVQVIGRAIVKYSLAGMTSLRLLVSEDNKDALAFYRKWGFRELSSQTGANSRLLLLERDLRGNCNGHV